MGKAIQVLQPAIQEERVKGQASWILIAISLRWFLDVADVVYCYSICELIKQARLYPTYIVDNCAFRRSFPLSLKRSEEFDPQS